MVPLGMCYQALDLLKMINVAVFGNGKVGSLLIDKIYENPDINLVSIITKTNQIFLDNKKPDLIVEAISDVEAARLILLKAIKHKQDIITCNKQLIYLYRNELFTKAINAKVSIYLNSIVSGSSAGEFPEPLNELNFNQYMHLEPFIFRGGGPQETSNKIYQDILMYTKNKLKMI
jgi:homoserine dehydrogenase